MSGNTTTDSIDPTLTGPSTPDTNTNVSSTPPATYSPGYRYITNPYGPGANVESGQGIPTGEQQPANATPTNPWPIDETLVMAILAEVQTRFRLLAMDNLRPQLTNDEIAVALYDAIDTLNNVPPATQFTIDQLFAVGADPRFRGVFYLCVAQKLVTTLLFDWTANNFEQEFNNFKVQGKLEDYRKLLEIVTTQVDEQLKRLKESSQKFVKRVVPANQSLIRNVGMPYRRPLGGNQYGGGTGGNWSF